MTRRALIAIVAFMGGALVLWWVLFSAVPRWFRGGASPTAAQSTPAATAEAQRKITATLFFTAEDGLSLVPVQREVPLAESHAIVLFGDLHRHRHAERCRELKRSLMLG